MSVDRLVDAIRAYVDAALDRIHERIDAIPQPRDGRDGAPGRDGEPGPRGFRGEDGTNGTDGVDGFGFDDLEVVHDGERGFAFNFHQGDRVRSFGPFFVPAMIFRGDFRDGTTYERGDTVTFGGSMWHCDGSNGNKPDDGVEGWTKVVRRGRDGRNGKDGRDGEKGDRGPEGRAGRDLTQMAMDGAKW